MTTIFIDSGPFRGAYNTRDQYSDRAGGGFEKIRRGYYKMVTTDYIIDESYTGILISSNYENAMEFDKLLRIGNMKIEKITPQRFAAAQEVFRRFNKDKKWSFTDCTSYVVMKELKIKDVFTFDENFGEMGFRVL